MGGPAADHSKRGWLGAGHLVVVDASRLGLGENPVEVLAVGRGLCWSEYVDRECVSLLVVLRDPGRDKGLRERHRFERELVTVHSISRGEGQRAAHCSSVRRVRETPSTGWNSKTAPPGFSPDIELCGGGGGRWARRDSQAYVYARNLGPAGAAARSILHRGGDLDRRG